MLAGEPHLACLVIDDADDAAVAVAIDTIDAPGHEVSAHGECGPRLPVAERTLGFREPDAVTVGERPAQERRHVF